MFNKIKKVLPWSALVGLVVAAGLMIYFSSYRSDQLIQSPETQAAADQVSSELTGLTPEDVGDPAFLKAVDQVGQGQYIVQIWLFDAAGNKVYTTGGGYSPVGSAVDLAVKEVKAAIQALPEGTLSPEQRMLLLVGSAIQAEGEHSDVYRYQVDELRSTTGTVTGYLGVIYDLSAWVGNSPQVSEILTVLGMVLGLGLYWISLAGWIFLDARQYGERAFIWLVFGLIGNLVVLVAYLLVRNPTQKTSS
jgi:hypothetical protein